MKLKKKKKKSFQCLGTYNKVQNVVGYEWRTGESYLAQVHSSRGGPNAKDDQRQYLTPHVEITNKSIINIDISEHDGESFSSMFSKDLRFLRGFF